LPSARKNFSNKKSNIAQEEREAERGRRRERGGRTRMPLTDPPQGFGSEKKQEGRQKKGNKSGTENMRKEKTCRLVSLRI
jgi:hypothetical protein